MPGWSDRFLPGSERPPCHTVGELADRITEEDASHAAANPHATVAPFAVNQIIHRTNDRLDHDIEVIVKHQVPIVITSLGARPEINEAVHSCCGIVLHDVMEPEAWNGATIPNR